MEETNITGSLCGIIWVDCTYCERICNFNGEKKYVHNPSAIFLQYFVLFTNVMEAKHYSFLWWNNKKIALGSDINYQSETLYCFILLWKRAVITLLFHNILMDLSLINHTKNILYPFTYQTVLAFISRHF